jgi:hypothetical protein
MHCDEQVCDAVFLQSTIDEDSSFPGVRNTLRFVCPLLNRFNDINLKSFGVRLIFFIWRIRASIAVDISLQKQDQILIQGFMGVQQTNATNPGFVLLSQVQS